MIWFFIKFIAAFVISFLILSIQFGSKPLFTHMSKLIGPLGSDIQTSVEKSLKTTVKNSKNLFDNSAPKGNGAKFQQARTNIQEDIKYKEKKALDKVINSN